MAEQLKEKLDRLKAKKGRHKGSVTKKINEAEQALGIINEKNELTDEDRNRLNVFHQILEQTQKVLQGYNEEILDLCDLDVIDKDIEESDESNFKIVEILAKLTEKLSIKLPSHGENSDSASTIGHSLAHLGHAKHMAAHTVKPNLPKLTLECFKGDVTTFQSIWDQFNSPVHANSSIPNTDKFKHLKALLEGTAASIIQGLTLTSLNHDHA